MPLPPGLQAAVAARETRLRSELQAMVNLDCGSFTPQGVNLIADMVQASLVELGAAVTRLSHAPADDQPQLGDLVIGRLAGSGPRVLCIGHMDTVFGPGTAAERPYHESGSRALGPGVADMKAGLLAGLHAIGALHAVGIHPQLTFVANPDEEIGSPFSGPHIRALAAEHDVALVLECARANGDIVSARKGIADDEITLVGRAAHAGVEPEKGRSAVLAAARLVVALHDLNGRWPGVTVNAGVIEGGTRANVVAEECRILTDLRAIDGAAFEKASEEVARLVATPQLEGVTAQLVRRAHHPPMEKTSGGARLAALAQALAADIGFQVTDALTGGASDANTTAAAGLPTLDGLGPVGGDDHSVDEWLDLDSIVPRTTLLAALIASVADALAS